MHQQRDSKFSWTRLTHHYSWDFQVSTPLRPVLCQQRIKVVLTMYRPRPLIVIVIVVTFVVFVVFVMLSRSGAVSVWRKESVPVL